MAVSLTQQVGNLLKRIIKSFNGKIAGILLILSNHKSAGSFGALAGFAIAIIFTWKFLRPPTGPQHNRRKSRGSESGSSTATRTDEVASFSKGSANDELVKLPLGEIVRKKLNGSRKMTCQLLGVILEESSPEELQEHATVRPSAVEVLSEISKSCDLYLMERILDDESGERALLALDNAGLFGNGGIMKDKVTLTFGLSDANVFPVNISLNTFQPM
ncbi:hypothetical protein GIB67_035951 [Kingdonia uniflora]|uniref:Peroxisome biogenesis protein 22 n=1 Tax=Kingdonia uniflora TaxID=39325 RepID=A0A7J7N151_9MAGN|nr:hypothetical protein GIB67_035951 [Kingdonia uniflora]